VSTPKKKPGGRREPPGGRPPKGNSRLVCYVQPQTRKAIEDEAEELGATLGEVVDQMQRRIDALASELMWLKFGNPDREEPVG
jgi:hypothetical protein